MASFHNISTAHFTRIPSWVSLDPKTSTSPSPSPPSVYFGKPENLHVISLAQQGKLDQAHRFLQEMDAAGVLVAPKTYENLLQECGAMKSLRDGKLIHDRIQNHFDDPPVFVLNSIVRMYCECGSFLDAEKLFDKMLDKSPGSWAVMISSYADHGFVDKALLCFLKMQELCENVGPSIYTSLLSALSRSSYLGLGQQLHCLVIKSGFARNVSMETALCNMYIKFGCLESAKWAFEHMVERNVVAWTGLMVGYTQAGRQDDAMSLFCRMMSEGIKLDEFVFSIALKACAGLRELEAGQQVHCLLIKLGLGTVVSVGTPLVDFYVKCGTLDSAKQAFDLISDPNDVSWSAIICGYVQTGAFEKCFDIFNSLRRKDSSLNEFIYTSIFQACSALADLNLGTQAHADAIKRNLVSNLHGESAMITMYAKCGQLDCAFRVFDSITEADTVAWTSVIASCAYHGHASKALSFFKKMQASGVRPNGVTFIAILTACSHCGLVKEAKQYLETMSSEYGVEPTVDHYDCMVDAYARAGQLNEALNLIFAMPFEPDTMSWKSLLGGCSIHRNLELGKVAAEKLLQLDPNDTAAYILMFNLHTSCGKLDEAANIRRIMSERGLKKEIGCSWISVKGQVHRFIVGDKHHPQTEEIYSKLQELNFCNSMAEEGVFTDERLSHNLGERKQQLLEHSERLAIAYGLIATPNLAAIIIYKNLRACRDCHDFAKHVSLVTGREIFVRDANRFHHFRRGSCSCGDYW